MLSASTEVVPRPALKAAFSSQTVGVFTDGVTYALKGDDVAASLDVTDTGKGNADGTVTVEYFLSGSGSLAGAREIFSQSQAIAIASGDSQTISSTFAIPQDANLAVPKTYRLFAEILDASVGGVRNVAVKGENIRLLPKVVNVITPGFLSDQPGGYVTWNQVATEMDKTIPAGTSLAGDVTGFVEKWAATAGFLQEMEGISAEAVSTSETGLQATLVYEKGAALIAAGKPTALRNANAAASGIVAKLSNPKSAYYVDPQLTTRTTNPQVIQFIGHSRGAAVNAGAALGLANLGYQIQDYVSLDGYSTDWPGLSAQAGDIPITADIQDAGSHIVTAVNYEVQQGIGPSLAGLLEKYAQNYIRLLNLTPASLELELAVLTDAKAPDRPAPPFVNITVQGSGGDPTSNHLNIGEIYLQSDSSLPNGTPNLPSDQQYILDNFEGQNLGG